jgi:hypothetical protein
MITGLCSKLGAFMLIAFADRVQSQLSRVTIGVILVRRKRSRDGITNGMD